MAIESETVLVGLHYAGEREFGTSLRVVRVETARIHSACADSVRVFLLATLELWDCMRQGHPAAWSGWGSATSDR